LRRISFLFGRVNQEGPHGRHLAGRRSGAKPLASPIGQEGAQVRRVKVQQAESPNLFTAMASEEFDQAMGGGDIRAHRMRTSPPIMGKMGRPACGKRPRRMSFPL
jgi:hypothetical protein